MAGPSEPQEDQFDHNCMISHCPGRDLLEGLGFEEGCGWRRWLSKEGGGEERE
jgi:hypothetical protein